MSAVLTPPPPRDVLEPAVVQLLEESCAGTDVSSSVFIEATSSGSAPSVLELIREANVSRSSFDAEAPFVAPRPEADTHYARHRSFRRRGFGCGLFLCCLAAPSDADVSVPWRIGAASGMLVTAMLLSVASFALCTVRGLSAGTCGGGAALAVLSWLVVAPAFVMWVSSSARYASQRPPPDGAIPGVCIRPSSGCALGIGSASFTMLPRPAVLPRFIRTCDYVAVAVGVNLLQKQAQRRLKRVPLFTLLCFFVLVFVFSKGLETTHNCGTRCTAFAWVYISAAATLTLIVTGLLYFLVQRTNLRIANTFLLSESVRSGLLRDFNTRWLLRGLPYAGSLLTPEGLWLVAGQPRPPHALVAALLSVLRLREAGDTTRALPCELWQVVVSYGGWLKRVL